MSTVGNRMEVNCRAAMVAVHSSTLQLHLDIQVISQPFRAGSETSEYLDQQDYVTFAFLSVFFRSQSVADYQPADHTPLAAAVPELKAAAT